jgi:hypothetical protein
MPVPRAGDDACGTCRGRSGRAFGAAARILDGAPAERDGVKLHNSAPGRALPYGLPPPFLAVLQTSTGRRIMIFAPSQARR